MAGFALSEIDVAALIQLIQYLTDEHLKPSTVVSYLQQLRPFFRDCVQPGLHLSQPVRQALR